MIKIARQTIEIDSCLTDFLQEKMTDCTCRTNLNSQLNFRQSYTGITDKTFVGNWTKNGFWISKFRKQLFQFRPDIIASFKIVPRNNITKIRIRYSIGFSSLFFAGMWILLASTIFIPFGTFGYIIGLFILTGLYSALSKVELDRIRDTINEKILTGFEILKSY